MGCLSKNNIINKVVLNYKKSSKKKKKKGFENKFKTDISQFICLCFNIYHPFPIL